MMKKPLLYATAFLATLVVVGAQEDGEWESLFNGESLEGWNGDPKFWSVEDGTITGRTTEENATDGNTFIIWEGEDVADFELKFEYRIVNGNSGVQYRSFKLENGKDEWRIGGYQGDFEAGDTYSGILYGENFRGILAERGQKTVIGEDGKPEVVGSVGDSKDIQDKIKKEDWNEFHVTATGFDFIHRINGVTTIESTDNDTSDRREKGLLAFQLHAGPPMLVQFRNVQLKRLDAAEGEQGREEAASDARSAASSELNEIVIQANPDGSYVIRTGRLSEEGLEKVLSGVGEMENEIQVRVTGRGESAVERIAKAVEIAKEAGLSEVEVQRRGERRRGQRQR